MSAVSTAIRILVAAAAAAAVASAFLAPAPGASAGVFKTAAAPSATACFFPIF